MEKDYCSDGKLKTYKSLVVTFKPSEVDIVFAQGFALVWPIINLSGLIERFQKVKREVLDTVDAMAKANYVTDDSKFKIQMLIGRKCNWVSFHLQIPDTNIYVPVLFEDRDRGWTKGRCMELSRILQTNEDLREHLTARFHGNEIIFEPREKTLSMIIPEDSIT